VDTHQHVSDISAYYRYGTKPTGCYQSTLLSYAPTGHVLGAMAYYNITSYNIASYNIASYNIASKNHRDTSYVDVFFTWYLGFYYPL